MDNFVLMKPFMLFGSSLMIVLVLIAALAFINTKSEIPEKHVEVVLRTIGHQLLLSAKDSTSRVLPVKKSAENTYQVSFQHEVGFLSDSLINIVHRAFQNTALAANYIVNLKNCEQKQTVLAFEMNSRTGDLTPCRGRTLEVGCYMIEIELLRANTFNFRWLWLLIIPLIVAGIYLKVKFQKEEPKESVLVPGFVMVRRTAPVEALIMYTPSCEAAARVVPSIASARPNRDPTAGLGLRMVRWNVPVEL